MIKVKNIYYMLAYAFQVLNEDGYKDIQTEEFEYVADLLSAILIKGVSNQIKRGLGREYVQISEAVSSTHGKIDIASSLKSQSILTKKLVCSYDEFSENFKLNQILKTTMKLLLLSKEVSLKNKVTLKKLIIYFSNVDEIELKFIHWETLKYNRNNATYKMLMNICYLVVKGMLLTEENGKSKLAKYIDDQKMHRLYEKFVLEYYRKHFPEFNPTASFVTWDVEGGNLELLPVMKSDITLTHNGKTLIIDTKYYGHIYQTNYDKKSFHSNNIYQIFTYVKNKDMNNSRNVSGILLYAQTDNEAEPDSDFMMGGNMIGIRSLDLNRDFEDIKEKLNDIVDMLR